MSPTKAIRPTTDTAAAVPIVAAATSVRRTRPTFTPRLIASSSPSESTSTERLMTRITTTDTHTYGRIRVTSAQPVLGSRPRIHE